MTRPVLHLRRPAPGERAESGATSASLPSDAAPSTASTDAELVARALRGERVAEDRLYRAHAAAVGAVVARLLGRTADAEDVLQDSFVTAFTRLAQLREPSRFRPWLVRIAVHQAHRRFRRRKLLSALGLDRGQDDASMSALASVHADGETRAELARLDAVLAKLPTDARIAWMLRHVEGYELTEVASACGVSLATCKRKLARAHALVAAHVSIDHEAPSIDEEREPESEDGGEHG